MVFRYSKGFLVLPQRNRHHTAHVEQAAGRRRLREGARERRSLCRLGATRGSSTGPPGDVPFRWSGIPCCATGMRFEAAVWSWATVRILKSMHLLIFVAALRRWRKVFLASMISSHSSTCDIFCWSHKRTIVTDLSVSYACNPPSLCTIKSRAITLDHSCGVSSTML